MAAVEVEEVVVVVTVVVTAVVVVAVVVVAAVAGVVMEREVRGCCGGSKGQKLLHGTSCWTSSNDWRQRQQQGVS